MFNVKFFGAQNKSNRIVNKYRLILFVKPNLVLHWKIQQNLSYLKHDYLLWLNLQRPKKVLKYELTSYQFLSISISSKAYIFQSSV